MSGGNSASTCYNNFGYSSSKLQKIAPGKPTKPLNSKPIPSLTNTIGSDGYNSMVSRIEGLRAIKLIKPTSIKKYDRKSVGLSDTRKSYYKGNFKLRSDGRAKMSKSMNNDEDNLNLVYANDKAGSGGDLGSNEMENVNDFQFIKNMGDDIGIGDYGSLCFNDGYGSNNSSKLFANYDNFDNSNKQNFMIGHSGYLEKHENFVGFGQCNTEGDEIKVIENDCQFMVPVADAHMHLDDTHIKYYNSTGGLQNSKPICPKNFSNNSIDCKVLYGEKSNGSYLERKSQNSHYQTSSNISVNPNTMLSNSAAIVYSKDKKNGSNGSGGLGGSKGFSLKEKEKKNLN